MTKRRAHRSGDIRSTSARKPSHAQLAARPDDVVLVGVDPTEEGVVLVVADRLPEGLGTILPPLRIPERVATDLTSRIAEGAGLANLGLQALNSGYAAQGLVRLAPETLALLAGNARPLALGGANLGTLVGPNGRFVAQVRWLPATGAGFTAALAAIGPALALAAMQFQLAAMSKKLDLLIEVTSEILRQSRTRIWAVVTSEVERLQELSAEADALGAVSDEVMNEARGAHRVLGAHNKELLASLLTSRRALADKRSASGRREWLSENGGVVLNDAQCLIAASVGMLHYEGMRAQHAGLTDPAHAAHILGATRVKSERLAADVGSALASLDRTLRLVEADPGSKRFRLFGHDRAPAEVISASQELIGRLAGLGVEVPPPRIAGAKLRCWPADASSPDDAPLSTLKLHLHPDEAMTEVWVGQESYLCITDERVFRVRRDSLAEAKWTLPWSDIASIAAAKGGSTIVFTDKDGEPYKFYPAGPDDASARVADLLVMRSKAHRRLELSHGPT